MEISREAFVYFFTRIVHCFDVRKPDEFLALITCSQQNIIDQMEKEIEADLVSMLLKMLEDSMLLDSPQALHLWAVAKFHVENRYRPPQLESDEELEQDQEEKDLEIAKQARTCVYQTALDVLSKDKIRLLQQYQRLLEQDPVILLNLRYPPQIKYKI
jgi:hypothetical protein